jgi:hypothetical protein
MLGNYPGASFISFLVVELKQKFCPAAPQVLFTLGHHFENSHSERHHAETSSNLFYSVQNEQPCPPDSVKWTRSPDSTKHVMSVLISIPSNEQTKIFEVPNKLISRSFESIMKPTEHYPFPRCGFG